MNVTARLESWFIDDEYSIIWGFVYDDTRSRWVDGTLIHTSTVHKLRELDLKKGVKVQTLNSVYLLGDPFKVPPPQFKTYVDLDSG